MSSSEKQPDIGALLAPEITELIDAGQMDSVREVLDDLLVAEIVDVLEALEEERRAAALSVLSEEIAADVFSLLEHDDQEELIEDMPAEQAASILNEMEVDERVDFIEDAPEEVQDAVLAMLDPEDRAETEKQLEYPEETIGRDMTPRYLTVRPEWTCAAVLDHIRKCGKEAESINQLYVVDENGRLIAYVKLKRVLLASSDTVCSELMSKKVIKIAATDDREQAVYLMGRHDIPVLPVVDEENHLVGIVTFDDVKDIEEEEFTEDMQRMGGMQELDEPYKRASVIDLFRKRVVWLVILFAGGLLTVSAMGVFEHSLKRYAILALFVPLIIASGGNSGAQAASLIVRSLAIEDVKLGDWWMVLRREVVSGLVLGGALGVLGFISGIATAMWIFPEDASSVAAAMPFGAAIGIAVLGVVLIGTLTGSMLPFGLQRVGIDPATSSAPLVATIVDVTGLVVYFLAANMVLDGLT